MRFRRIKIDLQLASRTVQRVLVRTFVRYLCGDLITVVNERFSAGKKKNRVPLSNLFCHRSYSSMEFR